MFRNTQHSSEHSLQAQSCVQLSLAPPVTFYSHTVASFFPHILYCFMCNYVKGEVTCHNSCIEVRWQLCKVWSWQNLSFQMWALRIKFLAIGMTGSSFTQKPSCQPCTFILKILKWTLSILRFPKDQQDIWKNTVQKFYTFRWHSRKE